MSEARTTSRIANLDLLRALAILSVLVLNAVSKGAVDLGSTLNHVAESGWIGVDLFFVLSGWLIGGLYWRERATFGNVQIGRFWARRWLRTIPPYLIAFAAITAMRYALDPPAFSLDPRYLVFLQNYASPIPYWAVSWSLAVEEHFYLALPLILGAAVAIRRGVPLALAAAVIGSLVSRVLFIEGGTTAWGLHYTATHMRLEGLALGVAAAYVFYEHHSFWPTLRTVARWLAVPSLFFIAAVPWLPDPFVIRVGYTVVDVAFAALLIAVVDAKDLPLARSRILGAIAVSSYSVYMTHTAVLDLAMRIAPSGVPLPLVAVVSLSMVAAAGFVFFRLVEAPSLALRSRIAPSRPPTVEQAAALALQHSFGADTVDDIVKAEPF